MNRHSFKPAIDPKHICADCLHHRNFHNWINTTRTPCTLCQCKQFKKGS